MSKTTVSQLTMIAILAVAGSNAQADVSDAAITKCAAIVADADRLSCFDTLAETVSTAVQVSIERRSAAAEAAKREAAEAEARQVQAFGASMKSAAEPEELDELTASVTSVSQLARGFQQVTLDNGQVWRQVDGILLIIRAGDEVVLKRGALDSFRMTVKRQRRTVGVKRVL